MDKIYSRRRIRLPKFTFMHNNYNRKEPNYKKINLAFKIIVVMGIAILTANLILHAITPIIDKQCINIAKSIATKISNEQATIVMSNYRYEDLCTITKDSNREYTND